VTLALLVDVVINCVVFKYLTSCVRSYLDLKVNFFSNELMSYKIFYLLPFILSIQESNYIITCMDLV